MDVLADVLSATRIDGCIFSNRRLVAPWGLAFPPDARAGFHIVMRGGAWIRLAGAREPARLEQGDVVLLAHGAGHALTSDPAVPPRPLHEHVDRPEHGGGPATTLVCGAYRFDADEVHPLLSLLPPLIHIRADEGELAQELAAVLALLSAEAAGAGPGSSAVVARLVDVLFIYIVRQWAAMQPGGGSGWLGALRDEQIGGALAAIHREPARDWDIDALAREIGMSRSTFTRRFRELVGEPPLGYLTRWRMDVAARLLRETDRSMAQIAARVGYRSEYAFNRAFQRSRGIPPGKYRSSARARAA